MQMDINKIYHYQYRRPRFNNPTLQYIYQYQYSLSNNVSSSLSFYNNGKIIPQRYHNERESQNKVRSSESEISLPKINKRSVSNVKNPQKMNEKYIVNGQKNVGMNFNDRDIYKKQDHSYDIITYQPKNHDQYIKKYPKLSLEQKDQYFRFKYQNYDQFNKEIQHKHMNNIQKNDKDEGKIAGMHTYRLNKQYQLPQPVDQISRRQNSNQIQKRNEYQSQPSNHRNFDMRMLNHIDQIDSYS